jgi:TIR domain
MPPSSGDNILEVFFSYSHKDEALCGELNAHLAALKRQNVIKNWTDRRITAGDEWRDEIEKHLDSADLILLLVSSDFLNSEDRFTNSGDSHKTRAISTKRDLFTGRA